MGVVQLRPDWKMGPCPICFGVGSSEDGEGAVCERCAGTGNVRHYADSKIGDEMTRLHPAERALRAELPQPECYACKNVIKREVWTCEVCGEAKRPTPRAEATWYWKTQGMAWMPDNLADTFELRYGTKEERFGMMQPSHWGFVAMCGSSF